MIPAQPVICFVPRSGLVTAMSLRTFNKLGVRFEYPSTWELSEEERGDGHTISLQSPGTAFWTLTIFEASLEPDELIEAAIETYREEYHNVDVYDRNENLIHAHAAGADLEFVCFDWVAYAGLRAIQSVERTLLVVFQGNDQEDAALKQDLEEMTRSLKSDDFPVDPTDLLDE